MSDHQNQEIAVRAAADLARQGTFETREIAGDHFALVHQDLSFQKLDTFQEKPRQLKQAVVVDTVDSFNDYLARFADPEQAVIFASAADRRLTAVLDYHKPKNEPSWGHHRCLYDLPYSEQWRRWIANSGKAMTQAIFAQFLEENAEDIAAPSAADVIMVAKTLQAKKTTGFSSATRLSDGNVELTFIEETQSSVGGGKIKVPVTEEFTLGIPVYTDGVAYKIKAKLRWRIGEDKALFLFYNLLRTEYILDDAFRQVVEAVKSSVAEGCLFFGKPSA